MRLPNGLYRTAAGSEMRISGEHGGISSVEFDWLEEGACFDCAPDAYADGDRLTWSCDECGGGSAELMSATHNAALRGGEAVPLESTVMQREVGHGKENV